MSILTIKQGFESKQTEERGKRHKAGQTTSRRRRGCRESLVFRTCIFLPWNDEAIYFGEMYTSWRVKGLQMICLMQVTFEPLVLGGTGRVNFKSHQAAVQLLKCICQQNYYCHPQISTMSLTLEVNWEALAVTQTELSCSGGNRKVYKTNWISTRSKTVPPYPIVA